MKAISIRQPWASLIVVGAKDVENRGWQTSHRGTLLIHAAKTRDVDAFRAARAACREAMARGIAVTRMLAEAGVVIDEALPLPMGAIIGVVDVLDVVQGSPSPWAQPGAQHWILGRPRMLPDPIPCLGQLSVFDVPADVAAQVKVPL